MGLWILTITAIVGCKSDPNTSGDRGGNVPSSVRLKAVNLNDVAAPTPNDEPIRLAAAKNEWTNFVIEVSGLPAAWGKRPLVLRVRPLMRSGGGDNRISPETVTAFQVLNMPIDGSRAGYIRHTGLPASNRSLPRALLPLKTQNGQIDLASARDPGNPIDPRSRATAATEPLLLWFDLHIPPETRAGDYIANCEVIESGGKQALAVVPIRVTVHDFVLPDDRHLMMVGALDWDDLTRLFGEFETITPRLMSRSDQRYEGAVQILDQLVDLAQRNRVQVVIPRLQPTVKWPPAKPPSVDWTDFDPLVAPWLKGDTFPDKTPFGYWPLPEIDNLSNFDRKSQLEYWQQAAAHFDQQDWLTRSSIVLSTVSNRRADSAEALRLSSEAADILSLNPRLRVEVPLEDDQVAFASSANDKLVQPASANRLITNNPGLVFSSPIRQWPDGVERPKRWLRTDRSDSNTFVGAGADERDVRLWAWFASVPLPPPPMGVKYGEVQVIRWPDVLPNESKPTDPADPTDFAWFYPGSWFGIDQPVPTIQLKWLRRAQQDYEYLFLAQQRGERLNALVISRLMSKPVELQPDQSPDPTYRLMSGTADAEAWNGALRLVAQRILLREPGQEVDQQRDQNLNLELNRWAEPQERPVAMGRAVTWLADNPLQALSPVSVRIGVDIYNAADRRPFGNSLEFAGTPSGWMHSPRPIAVNELGTYHVQRFAIGGQIDSTKLRNNERKPVDITFTDGFTRKQSTVRMVLPAVTCDRREGRLNIDGSLEDWMSDDAIQDGPLVRMFNRPALQKQELQYASTPANVYAGWADKNLYVAFKLTGLSGTEARGGKTNFVEYSFRRAWYEDLSEMLIQPVYDNGDLGPVLHVVSKPNGSLFVERKLDPRQFDNPWQEIQGSGIRYAATIDGPDWRGELAIPWQAITADPAKARPVLIRFNLTQHKNLTGESASWAGPIDFGRDENFTGVLILRELQNPGMPRG